MTPTMTRIPPNRKGISEPRDGARQSATPGTPGLELQFAALQTQLDMLKAQVRQAQQLAGLGTAAATIAHEVNNLLTPILAYGQAALDSNDPGLREKALSLTVKHVRMLISMSDRLLQISAASAVRRESVNVRTAVEEAKESLCRDLAKDGIRFLNRVDPSVAVEADGLQLQQVFFNLFLNAREAMAPTHNGTLSVGARCEGGRVLIETQNSGAPIPRELVDHVFERLQSSKSVGEDGRRRCAGLGLALCRDLIEENHGTIRVVRTGEEEGTTFVVDLPAAENKSESGSRGDRATGVAPAAPRL
jgi:signal transduction histidine kinase